MKRAEGDRLVYYGLASNSKFWNDKYNKHDDKQFFTKTESGHLGVLEKPLIKYLPKNGIILDAGCGLGQYVLALLARGYEAEGIDYAKDTVDRIKKIYPDLPIRFSDAMHIDASDESYTGYISFGVMEHVREGPAPFLREAYRVLKPGGIAIISVPHYHLFRKLKTYLGFYRNPPVDQEFYQYAFLLSEFSELVTETGFTVLDWPGYDSYKGIKDEILDINWLLDRRVGSIHLVSVAQRLLYKMALIENYFGHMLLLICQKGGSVAGK